MHQADLAELLRGYPLEGFERSIKLMRGCLYPERSLAGVSCNAIALADMLRLGTRLGMPVTFLDEMAQRWPLADTVHVGTESSADGVRYKVYLEFWRELNRARGTPVLLHQAWKWLANDPGRCGIGRYFCYPDLSFAALQDRLAALYRGAEDSPSLAVARAVLDLALRRSAAVPMYLEVEEEGGPRHSFDLRFYESGLRLADVDKIFLRMAKAYEVAEPCGELLATLGGAALGHLAGGRDRHGEDFLTIYYAYDD